MGVAGSGKSTVAQALATALGWTHADGDDFHSPDAVAEIASGRPLTDADRAPWLARLAEWISAHERAGDPAVLACSALTRGYRRTLAEAGSAVVFCHLVVPADVLRARLAGRANHFLGPDLLDSQLAALEPLEADERGFTVDATRPLDEVVAACLRPLRG